MKRRFYGISFHKMSLKHLEEVVKIKIKSNQMEEIEGMTSAYPYTMHHTIMKETRVPWHWHEELEINYIVEGEAKFSTTNRVYTFRKGEAFFINSNVLCTLEEVKDCVVDSHLFHPAFLGGHFKSVFETKYLDPVIQNKKIEVIEISGETENQNKILTKLVQAAKLQYQENTEFQTRNLFSEIWLLLLEEMQTLEEENGPVASVNQERLLTMLSYIQENFSEKISLEDIASSALISRRECLRCFQLCIHQSPFEYLLGYRVEMAKKMLKTTNDSILEIAMRTGFQDGAYFSKMFKKNCGKTPGAYRKMYREV